MISTKTKILAFQLSCPGWASQGGCVEIDAIKNAEEGVNKAISDIEHKGCDIEDIKVNHFVATGTDSGYNEVWVQYTIVYTRDVKPFEDL